MKHMRTALAVTTAALLVGSCGDVVNPSRLDIYDWRLPVGSELLSFSWPRSTLPVRVWVEDSLGLPGHTQTGIETWKGQFLYQEFDAVLVSDSTTADVLVGVSISELPKPLEEVRLHSLADECEGVTGFAVPSDSTIALPFRIRISPRTTDPLSPASQSCFALTVTHELGHAIGLFQHSSDANDLMFTSPVAGPSKRDRNTAQQLYHFPADLTVDR